MGLKGGLKGGSSNTEDQFKARQKVGLTFGRSTGIGNQSSELKDFISNGSIWAFKSTVASLPTCEQTKDSKNSKDRKNSKDSNVNSQNKSNKVIFCLITPKESFVDIARTLNSFVPNSIPLKNVATMHKLVKNLRPQMYGWNIVYRLIRSEIREGIKFLYEKHPDQILKFEQDFLNNEIFE